MGLLDALSQYLSDVLPGGSLNPELDSLKPSKDTPKNAFKGTGRGLLDFSLMDMAASLYNRPLTPLGMVSKAVAVNQGAPVQAQMPSDQIASMTGLDGSGPMYNAMRVLGPMAMGATFAGSAPSRGTLASPNQEGAIRVWHGSPHKFDKFDSSKIGTGEGAQAFGHGGYFAENPAVAADYMHTGMNVDPSQIKYKGVKAQTMYDRATAAMNRNPNDKYAKAAAYFWEGVLSRQHPDSVIKSALSDPSWPELFDYAKSLKPSGFTGMEKGNMYKGQLRWPDAAREASDPLGPQHFLDWDKPLSEQSKAVQDAINSIPQRVRGVNVSVENSVQDLLNGLTRGKFNNPSNSFSAGNASVSLNKAGIPGITYLDAGSRAAGEGTRNFVTFSDDLIDLLSRNGQAIPKPRPKTPFELAHEVAQRNAALPVEQGGLGLPPGNTAMERARAMGWDTDIWHGQRPNVAKREYIEGLGSVEVSPAAPLDPISSITPGAGKGEGGAFFGVNDPKIAEGYAEKFGAVYPLKARSEDFKKLGVPEDFPVNGTPQEQAAFMQRVENFNRMLDKTKNRYFAQEIRAAEKEGAKGVVFKNVEDSAGQKLYDTPADIYASLTAPLRSRFAAFDPFKRDSADLLAGLAGAGLLSPMLIDALQER